jgi:prepilin-type N-terminal cleavage/methylation domain-containing protein
MIDAHQEMLLARQTPIKSRAPEFGFTLTELMIALMVFTLITSSVIALLVKSQAIFRTEQGVSEMDQNARLLIDFLTRDIQEAKENALGISPRLRSIYSYNGPEGKTDELIIVSSDTESKLPATALPFIPASSRAFSAYDRYVEVLPNGAARIEPRSVLSSFTPDEHLIISSTLENGSVQFDIVKVKGARLTETGSIGISFEPVSYNGVRSEVPFGSTYENGSFTIRPIAIKRYFVDKSSDKNHPTFALSTGDGAPIPIARNIVAFGLRYLEVREGEGQGYWVKEQTIAPGYRTEAIEVTLTARTEIKGDKQAERLVTLASVIRPRFQVGSGGLPGTASPGRGSIGSPGSDAGGSPTGPDENRVPTGGFGFGGGDMGQPSGWPRDGQRPGYGSDAFKRETRRIGSPPRLGQRLTRP